MSDFYDSNQQSRYLAPASSIFIDLTYQEFENASIADKGESTRMVWHEILHYWLLSSTSYGVFSQIAHNSNSILISHGIEKNNSEGRLKFPLAVDQIDKIYHLDNYIDFLKHENSILHEKGYSVSDNAQQYNLFDIIRIDKEISPYLYYPFCDINGGLMVPLGITSLVEGFSEVATKPFLSEEELAERREKIRNFIPRTNGFSCNYFIAEDYFGYMTEGLFPEDYCFFLFLDFVWLSLMIEEPSLETINNNPGSRFLLLISAAQAVGPVKLDFKSIPKYLDTICVKANLMSRAENVEKWLKFCQKWLPISEFGLAGLSSRRILKNFEMLLNLDHPTVLMLEENGRSRLFNAMPPALIHLKDSLWMPEFKLKEWYTDYQLLRGNNPDVTAFILYSICHQAMESKFIECPFKFHGAKYKCGCDYEKVTSNNIVPNEKSQSVKRCAFLSVWRQILNGLKPEFLTETKT
jgi:hypothetical protein